MRSSLSAIVLTLALVAGASAQDVSPLQRRIDTLPIPVTAAELRALAKDSPNAYVYFVQGFLAGRGLFDGSLDGQLKPATVKAILSYCRERDFERACAQGPLLPEAIEAVALSIAEELAPKLPQNWLLDDNGSHGSVGLVADIQAADADGVTLHIHGTAQREGYYNINLGEGPMATPGTWTGEVTAMQSIGASDTLRNATFGAALMSDKAYAGELFSPVPLPTGGSMERLRGSGTPPPEAKKLVPYVQLWVFEGDVIDTVLELDAPTLTSQ